MVIVLLTAGVASIAVSVSARTGVGSVACLVAGAEFGASCVGSVAVSVSANTGVGSVAGWLAGAEFALDGLLQLWILSLPRLVHLFPQTLQVYNPETCAL